MYRRRKHYGFDHDQRRHDANNRLHLRHSGLPERREPIAEPCGRLHNGRPFQCPNGSNDQYGNGRDFGFAEHTWNLPDHLRDR
ncbi:hypothetical protein D3C78_1721140 [compost metagenome]